MACLCEMPKVYALDIQEVGMSPFHTLEGEGKKSACSVGLELGGGAVIQVGNWKVLVCGSRSQ